MCRSTAYSSTTRPSQAQFDAFHGRPGAQLTTSHLLYQQQQAGETMRGYAKTNVV